jgi:hypothetical protein
MRDKIFQIVEEEFSSLISKIQSDFVTNFKAKQHNFLLKELDTMMSAHMVFVSSFESKSGNSIQKVAKEIAKLRYGSENVPQIVNPHNLQHNIQNPNEHEQIIVSNVDMHNPELQGKISEFMTRCEADKKRKISCSVNHETILELLDFDLPITNEIYTKPVDLAFYDGDILNIMEIKAGGNLDSSNAPSNAKKLLTIYTGLNYSNTKPYFATIYHKDGEGKNWSGSIKKYLQYPDMFLIGSAFWNKILPAGIDFNEFVKIYNEAINQINLNEKLNEMIKSCS